MLCQRILLCSCPAGRKKRTLPLSFTVFIYCNKVTQPQYCLEHLFERSNKLDFLSSPARSEDSDLILSHNSRRREERWWERPNVFGMFGGGDATDASRDNLNSARACPTLFVQDQGKAIPRLRITKNVDTSVLRRNCLQRPSTICWTQRLCLCVHTAPICSSFPFDLLYVTRRRRHGRAGSISVHLARLSFKSWPWDPLSCDFQWFSSVPPEKCLDQRFPTCAPRSLKGSACTSQGLRGRSRKIK